MNNTWKVSKYLISDFKKSLAIYYGIMLTLTVVFVVMAIRLVNRTTGNVTIGGLGSASLIFLFIAGLNSFKTNFKFMQANNVSRKRFMAGSVVTLTIVSALMAVIDSVITVILSTIIPYEGFFKQIYNSDFFFGDVIWSFASLTLFAFLGFFITMLYYRCNKLMKVVVSISPVVLMILINLINDYKMGIVRIGITKFFTWAFSLNSLNPYIAALNTLIGAALLVALCYLLIYKAPIKD
ncbi:MAG: hypothetical protein K0R84_2120 [Clostridia bacterium]|nr:hypothetical protein [Clostridia bacterium]